MSGDPKRYNAFFRQILFLVGLIAVGLIIFKQLNFFFGSFLGAFTLYVVLRNAQFKMVEKWHLKPWLGSLMLVVATTIVLLALGFLVFEVIFSQVSTLDSSQVVTWFNGAVGKISKFLNIKIAPSTVFNSSKGMLTNAASSIANATYSFVANIFMMIIILYFMLAHGRLMEKRLSEYMPFKGENQQIIKLEVKNMIYSNAVGMPIILIAQTLTSSLIYWLLDVNAFFFWGLLTALCGLIPVVGTTIVYIPIAIIMMVNGSVWQGIALLIYGVIVISNTDNLLRIVLLKRMTNTHPLITIFGVILGLPLFGFWGIIFGPLLLSGFFLLIKMYYLEYKLIPPEDAHIDALKELNAEEEHRKKKYDKPFGKRGPC